MDKAKVIEYLKFKRMITPLLIQGLFWIGAVFQVISGLVYIVKGASSDYGGGATVLYGLFLLLVGPLITRVTCELIILFFSINENIADLRDIVITSKNANKE